MEKEMNKVLFLIVLTLVTACSNAPLRQEEDCMNACSMIANDLVKVIPQGCVCQEKPKK
jgi:hypothetical protein